MTGRNRVAYVIACSAPPVLHLDELLILLAAREWDSYVILSPTAATWVDVYRLAEVSGHPVRVEPRTPQDPDPLPPADVILAAPLTFNSLDKLAAGISDTLALGLLSEALGLGLPITAAPCIKEALRQHPAYDASVRLLASAGVNVLDPKKIVTQSALASATLDWSVVVPT